MSTQDDINKLREARIMGQQPSFDGLQAPPDPNQLGLLQAQLQQQQDLTQAGADNGDPYGFLTAPSRRSAALVGQSLSNLLGGPGAAPQAAPAVASPTDTGLPPPNQPGPNSQPAAPVTAGPAAPLTSGQVSQAIQQGKRAYQAMIAAGVPPDQAKVNTLKMLVQAGVSTADEHLDKVNEQLLKNAATVAQTGKDTAQANMDTASIPEKTVDNQGKTWTTTYKDPNGLYMLQTNQNGEVKRTELSPPPNAAAAAAAAVTPDQMAAMVQSYKLTGDIPAGVGRGGPVFAGKFYAAVAADATANGTEDSPLAIKANKLALQANGAALKQTSNQLAATTSYLSTMNKNIDQARALAHAIDFGDLKAFNAAEAAYLKGTSDPRYAKYNVFFDAIGNEYAKLKSGSLGNSPVSDSARREAFGILSPIIGVSGVDGVFDAIKQEGDNRVSSLAEQKQNLIDQISGKTRRDATAAPTPAATGGGAWTTLPNGVKIRAKS